MAALWAPRIFSNGHSLSTLRASFKPALSFRLAMRYSFNKPGTTGVPSSSALPSLSSDKVDRVCLVVVTFIECADGSETWISGLSFFFSKSSGSFIVTMKKNKSVTKISIKGTIETVGGFRAVRLNSTQETFMICREKKRVGDKPKPLALAGLQAEPRTAQFFG